MTFKSLFENSIGVSEEKVVITSVVTRQSEERKHYLFLETVRNNKHAIFSFQGDGSLLVPLSEDVVRANIRPVLSSRQSFVRSVSSLNANIVDAIDAGVKLNVDASRMSDLSPDDFVRIRSNAGLDFLTSMSEPVTFSFEDIRWGRLSVPASIALFGLCLLLQPTGMGLLVGLMLSSIVAYVGYQADRGSLPGTQGEAQPAPSSSAHCLRGMKGVSPSAAPASTLSQSKREACGSNKRNHTPGQSMPEVDVNMGADQARPVRRNGF